MTKEMSSSALSVQPQLRSLVEIRAERETRTSEALKMKDQQIEILTEQNKKLLNAVDHAEEEINALQLEKIHVDEENQTLRENNFDIQTKNRITDAKVEDLQTEITDAKNQLKVMTIKNTELLKLLESEEANNAKLSSEGESSQVELRELKAQHTILLNSSNNFEGLVKKASQDSQLQEKEIRLLRAEVETLKHNLNEKSMRDSVEIESLQEQLRVRKEKQYQLLEKLQLQEEIRRQAEDQVLEMEEKIKELRTKTSDAETNLQIEMSAKLKQEEINTKLNLDMKSLSDENQEISSKLHSNQKTQVKLESEARESGDQLREMAEKVFQLLERLKLAELGKTRSMEALRSKEQEVHVLKKKNSHLLKESIKEGKARVKAELDKKIQEDQIKALKKHNLQLGQRCKDEAKSKIREEERKREAEEKVKTLNGRLSFLLNRLQTDKEERDVHREETNNLHNRLEKNTEDYGQLQKQLERKTEECSKQSQELISTNEEFEKTRIKLESLQKLVDEQEEMKIQRDKESMRHQNKDNQNGKLSGGKLRFFVDSKPTLGIVLLKGKCAKDKEWLDSKGCNYFLRKALKSKNSQEQFIQKLADIYGILLTKEEDCEVLQEELKERNVERETINRKLTIIHRKIALEEESKRRTLLRYVNAVKASVSLGEPGCEKNREEVGNIGSGKIILPETSITDEEVHAIAALLKNNQTIVELNLRRNMITDEGCRALAAILTGEVSLRVIDLRQNHISSYGIKVIVEALQSSKRVRHVHVHAGGKIEAMGIDQSRSKMPCDQLKLTESDNDSKNCLDIVVDTVCIVDIRDNSTDRMSDTQKYREDLCISPFTPNVTVSDESARLCKAECRKKKIDKKKKLKKDIQKNLERHRQDSNSKEVERHGQNNRPKYDEKALLREQGWSGRSGGLDISLSQSWGGSSNIPQRVKVRTKEHAVKHSSDVGSDRPKSAGAAPSANPINESSTIPVLSDKKKMKSSKISSKAALSPFVLN